MPWIAQVESESGGVLARLVVHHHQYVLDGGRTASMETCVAWCDDCRRFTVAEDLKTPQALERQEAQATARYLELRQAPAGDMAPDMQAEMVRRVVEAMHGRYDLLRQVMEKRESPARCLECGGTRFQRVERDVVEWVDHPQGNGRVRVVISGQAQVSEPPLRYSVEGVRLDPPAPATP